MAAERLSEPLQGHVIRLGEGQTLQPFQSPYSGSQPMPYVILQQAAPEPSWLKEHSGQLVAGAGAGVLAIALLLTVAIVAVAVGLGAISLAIGWMVIKSLMGPQTKK